MKAAQINSFGGNEVIQINDTPVPTVSAGKILVEVHASGVNPSDWKIRQGYMGRASIKFPVTLGGDFAGKVIDVGEGVTDFKKGDEVYGSANVLSGGSGSFAEFLLADQKRAAKKPKNITIVEAGALPLTGVSAYQGLIEHMKLKKGQKILIHGGAGGIGTVAIQLAKFLGAHVATTAKTEDLDYVKSLSADEVIDYKKQKFEDIVRDFDAVFDTVGSDTYARSFGVLKKGGIIVSMLEQPKEDLMKQFSVTAIGESAHVTAERLEALAKLVERDAVKVHIERSFPLEEAATALAYLDEKHPNGKIILRMR